MRVTNKVGASLAAFLLLVLTCALGDVKINEFSALSSDRKLRWTDAGQPYLGAGTPWWEIDFDDTAWPPATAPIGFNYPQVISDLGADMYGLTPSLYLRRKFTLTSGQAASTANLLLDIDYDDGFIVYINGVEAGRANMGAPNGFVYADQPSYNAHAWTANETFTLGRVVDLLQEGENVIAIQVHNASLTSGALLFDAALRKTTGGAVTYFAKGSPWNYFVGRVEPSGGVFDPAFLPDATAFEPDWAKVSFDDSTWTDGAGPLGFDAAVHYPLGTDLDGMRNNQSVLYTRKSFSLDSSQISSIASMTLTMDYDDGYVAFLNGKEIARANLGPPGLFVPFDATASSNHNASMDSGGNNPGAIQTVAVDPALLVEGVNVFSVQICNNTLGSSDLMVISDLTTNGGSGPQLVANNEIHKYFIGTEEPAPVEDNSEEAIEPNFVDWIELHNDGATDVDLTGWSLSDDDDDARKWVFPDGTMIEAGGYLLVLADGVEPEAGATDLLHANFKLSGDGEFLALYNAAGAVQTEFDSEYPRQYDYHSYGTNPAGGGQFGYLSVPTPGAANTGTFLSGRTKSPDFSTEGGFHTGTVNLSLTSDTQGATIRYTTDGSEPTATHGTVYSTPISLSQINDKTGHVIRARSFASGLIPSRVKTHTFLIDQHPNLRSAPALIFTGDDARIFYKEHGIMAIEGGTYVNNRWQANGIDSYNIPINRGRPFERPFFMEFYYGDGREGFREDAGIRLSSSNYSRPRLRLTNTDASPWASSATHKPSFNIFLRGDYGEEFIDHQWLYDGYSVDKYAQLRIRAGKNDIRNPFIADEVVRRLYTDMGQHSSNGIVNTVYINGEFKGFFNMAERLREPFFQEHHDSNEEWDVRQVGEFANGDSAKWNEMVALMGQDMTNLANYQAVQQLLDVDNLIDYLLLNIYGCTWDWPQNNWVAARERSDTGLYRFYVWDAEGAIGRNRQPSYDTIQTDLINKNNDIPRIFKFLRNSPEFRLRWADRIQKHFFNGGALDDTDIPNSKISQHWTALAADHEPLLNYVHNESVNSTRLTIWTHPDNGKRAHLFGPANTQFANHGLWPALRAPVFSRHGGNVSAGYRLTMTHSGPGGSVIYSTTDGTDPRLPGGAIAPTAAAYSNGVEINNLSTKVMARVYVPSTSEWSPLIEADFTADFVPVKVNEVLAHTDLPQIDSIELHNPSQSSVDISGWFLTDDSSTPKKFEIPNGTIIPARGYVVFDENDFFGGPNGFRLSEYGEDAYLFSADENGNLTGYSDGWDFQATPNGVSLGRYVDLQGKEHFVLQESITLGAQNSLPKVGPVIVSEIHYHPTDLPGNVDNPDDEFVELTNISSTTVPLYNTDTSVPGYGNAALNDTWRLRNAVDYDFPPGVVLAPGQRVLVVGFDPDVDTAQLADLRTKFSIPSNIDIYGPWSGKLDNSGEELELKFPGNADPLESFFVPYYTAEEIDYRDDLPWPVEADGDGSSLQRRIYHRFGNDPDNWAAATPQSSEGRDTDGDEMEDWWELLYGLAVGTNDAALDRDRDGESNLREFLARTIPNDPRSYLKLLMDPDITGMKIRFTASGGVSYKVQYTESLLSPDWQDLHDIPAAPEERFLEFDITPTGTKRFYRVIIPELE